MLIEIKGEDKLFTFFVFLNETTLPPAWIYTELSQGKKQGWGFLFTYFLLLLFPASCILGLEEHISINI